MNTFWGLTSRDFYAGYKGMKGMPKTFSLERKYLRTSSYSVIKQLGLDFHIGLCHAGAVQHPGVLRVFCRPKVTFLPAFESSNSP